MYRDLRALLDAWPGGRERVIIGEMHLYDLEEWALFFGEGDEMQLPFNFGLLKVSWDARSVAEHVEAVEEVTARPGRWPSYVLGNHDERRVASRLGEEQAAVAMTLLVTLRGTPTLYYGDELGHPDVPIPPGREQDPWGLRVPGLALSRDPARTPMPWSSGDNAGFTDAAVTPWLPVIADTATYSVAAQEHEPASLLQLTRCLIAARREHPALSVGAQRTRHVDDTTFVYERTHGGERVVVALSFSASVQQVDLGSGRAEVLVSLGPRSER